MNFFFYYIFILPALTSEYFCNVETENKKETPLESHNTNESQALDVQHRDVFMRTLPLCEENHLYEYPFASVAIPEQSIRSPIKENMSSFELTTKNNIDNKNVTAHSPQKHDHKWVDNLITRGETSSTVEKTSPTMQPLSTEPHSLIKSSSQYIFMNKIKKNSFIQIENFKELFDSKYVNFLSPEVKSSKKLMIDCLRGTFIHIKNNTKYSDDDKYYFRIVRISTCSKKNHLHKYFNLSKSNHTDIPFQAWFSYCCNLVHHDLIGLLGLAKDLKSSESFHTFLIPEVHNSCIQFRKNKVFSEMLHEYPNGGKIAILLRVASDSYRNAIKKSKRHSTFRLNISNKSETRELLFNFKNTLVVDHYGQEYILKYSYQEGRVIKFEIYKPSNEIMSLISKSVFLEGKMIR